MPQYSIFEPRIDSEAINMGEAFGKVGFSFYSETKFDFTDLDPRIGHYKLLNGYMDYTLHFGEDVREV